MAMGAREHNKVMLGVALGLAIRVQGVPRNDQGGEI